MKKIMLSLRSTRFVQDVFTLQISSIFSLSFNFITSIIYARMLGIEAFGIYAIILAFRSTFGTIISLGQNQATTTFLAESYAKKNIEEMKEVLHYHITMSFISIGALTLLAIISPQIANYLYNDKSIGVIARIGFLGMIAGSFHTMFFIILQTLRRIKLLSTLENINLLLQLGITTSLLILGYEVYGIFIGLLISNITMQIILIAIYRKIKHDASLPNLRRCIFCRHKVMPLFKQGIWIAIDKNINGLFIPSALLILSTFSQASTIGVARLAYNIGLLPASLLLKHAVRMGTTILPAIPAQGNAALRKATAQLIKHTIAIHACISFGALVALPPLVIILYGWSYSEMIAPMLWIILFGIIRGLFVANGTLLRIYKKAHIGAMWNSFAFTVSILLLLFLLQFIQPLNAFLIVTGIYFIFPLYINWYLYHSFFKEKY